MSYDPECEVDKLCCKVDELEREITQLRQDRDHLDQQHRFILTEKNNLQAERDGMSHDLKQVREALGCDGSDLPQLLGAIDGLKDELLSTRQKLPSTAQAMVYQGLLMKFKSAESRLKELELDNTLLREQIRVADVAFNHLHGEHQKAQSRLKEAEKLLEWHARLREAFLAGKPK